MSAFKKVENDNTFHTYADEERQAFSSHINHLLGYDELLRRHLPLDDNTEGSKDLFEKMSDGLIMLKLINYAVPETVDDRAINKQSNMNVYQKTENINLALNAAKSIGCQVVNIGAQDIIEGRPILILVNYC
jgi:plastin-1